MQGINDSIQSNNKQINRSLEESISELEPSQNDVSIFDTNKRKKDFFHDEDKLANFTIGAGIATLGISKGVSFFNKLPKE